MATVTQEIPAQTDDILKPAGQGTPVSQWWECCLPKTPSSQMKGASGPDGTSPRKQHVSFQDDHTIETVDKNKDDDEVGEIPDMDNPSTTKVGTAAPLESPPVRHNLVTELFHLIFNMFFLHWAQEGQNKKRIKHHQGE